MDTSQIQQLAGLLPMPSDRLWFDPAMLTAATYPQITDVPIAAANSNTLLTPNPRRWGVFLARINPAPINIQVGPWPDPSIFYLWSPSLNTDAFYTLFNFGPLVCGGWYASSFGATTLRVIELIRQGG